VIASSFCHEGHVNGANGENEERRTSQTQPGLCPLVFYERLATGIHFLVLRSVCLLGRSRAAGPQRLVLGSVYVNTSVFVFVSINSIGKEMRVCVCVKK